MSQSQQDTGVEVYNEYAKMTLNPINQAKDVDICHVNPEILHQIRECAQEVFLMPKCKADKIINLLESILESIDRQSKRKVFNGDKFYLVPEEIYHKHRNNTNFDWLKDWEVSSGDKKILPD